MINPVPLKVVPLFVTPPTMLPLVIVTPVRLPTSIPVPAAGLAVEEMVNPFRSSVTLLAAMVMASPELTVMLFAR